MAPADDVAAVRRLTDDETIDLGETLDFGAVDAQIEPIDGDAVLVKSNVRGSVQLLRVSAGGQIDTLTSGNCVVQGFAASSGTIAVSYADAYSQGEVGVIADVAGGVSQLTDFAAPLRNISDMVVAVEEAHAAGDGYPVHGWVFLPKGEGPHPVLLNIHGGPYSQYLGGSFWSDAQVYVDAGYAVVLCNPRGSSGYGQAHGRAIKGSLGHLATEDVLAFLDGAIDQHPELDGARVGIMGGSYGGYLTAWIIGQDHRFKAAVVERGYLDPPSFVGSSDIGWVYSIEYTGSDPRAMREQSPLNRVGSVTTPTFLIQAEDDLRCPIDQGYQYYAGLKAHDVPTQMLIFPGESHALNQAGTPRHRQQRYDEILKWWADYLPLER